MSLFQKVVIDLVQGMYIHIPFCTHICHYCDFNKVFLKGQPVDPYIESLGKEIEMVFKEIPPVQLETIFIGGGTPTALTEKQLYRLFEIIHSFVDTRKLREFTIEANPGDLTKEKLAVLKEGGISRLSLGAQTFNDQLLEKIGRSHRAKDIYETIDQARKLGFENINIDLMYGLPGQTIEDVKNSLLEIFRLEVPHCSAYSLIVEPKTVFYNLMRKGKLSLPTEDEEASMYELVMDEMEKHGLKQYEISNYAKNGYESFHNLIYWNNDFYYGFGAGAHSYINNRRRANINPINKYIEKINHASLPIREEIPLTTQEQMEEEMFLGLRKTEGVSIQKFQKKFGSSPCERFDKQIHKLINMEFIEIINEHIRLTRKGKLLGNIVFQEFINES